LLDTLKLLIAEIEQQEQAAIESIQKEDFWNIVANCLTGTIREKFLESLDKWLGFYKIVGAIICVARAVVQIIITEGANIIGAIITAVRCYILWMIGSALDSVIDIVNCIIQNA
jgi:hypothetical protein